MLTSGFIPPVDNRQVTGGAAESAGRRELMSRSDLKGVFTHASQSLAEVSGFARHQLIGRPHNILRHPDVSDSLWTGPKTAYATARTQGLLAQK